VIAWETDTLRAGIRRAPIQLNPANQHLPWPAAANAQSNKLKSRVDFKRLFDSFHVPLYWNLDENAFAES
jgi:hypothetical protein